jgi:hypothetical protein
MFLKSILLVLIAGWFNSSYAQTVWRSILYPEDWKPGFTLPDGRFLHDFSYAGYHAGEKDVPSVQGKVYNVTEAPYFADNTGSADVTAILQKALNDAGQSGGGVVFLPAGTYRIKPGTSFALRIGYSNVILRGEGSNKTFLFNDEVNMRSKDIILVRPLSGGTWTTPEGSTAQLTKDLPGPETIIPVSSVSPFKVGDKVIVTSNVTTQFIAEHEMQQMWTTSGMGGPMFYRIIVKVDPVNSAIVLDAPTRYSLKMRDNARVYVVNKQLEEIGIEELSVGSRQILSQGWGEEDYTKQGTGAYDAHGSHAIKFYNTINSWLRNVSSYRPVVNYSGDFHLASNGVLLYHSRHITLMGCNFQKPQYEGGGGNGYMYTLQGNDCLITHCVAVHSRHNYDFKTMVSNGNVILRSLGKDSFYSSDFHMWLSMANLIDNFTVDRDYLEAKFRPYGSGNMHGHPTTQSVYWNTTGLNYHGTKQFIIDSKQFGWGYIIGTQGAANKVSTTPVSGTQGGYAYNSAPEDHTEGIGLGKSLQPQSLYEDQLAKRLTTSGSGMTERLTNRLEIYPNPAKSHFTFSCSENPVSIKIYDLTGSLFLDIREPSDREISIGELPAGLYIVSMTGLSGNTFISKLIKID